MLRSFESVPQEDCALWFKKWLTRDFLLKSNGLNEQKKTGMVLAFKT